MRSLKFKIYDTQEKYWLDREHFYITGEGYVFSCQSSKLRITNTYRQLERDRFVVVQFTGLKDKNGKEIYGEGDIYKDAFGIISVVKMAVDGWALFPINKGTPVRNLYWHNICDKTKGEVIGNIIDDPKLLEQGK